MIRLFALVLFSLATINLINAQSTDKQHEIGIALTNFQSIGVTYKIGKSNALWRFTTLIGNGTNSESVADTIVDKSSYSGVLLRAGREWRKAPTEKIEMRWGFDLFYNYNYSYRSSNRTGTFRDNARESRNHYYGLNAVLGANYLFNDNLFIGIEILPYVRILSGRYNETNLSTGEEQDWTVSEFSYGLDSSSALFVFGFRF